MPEQPRFDLLRFERLAQERVFKEINLTDAQIVGGAPVAIHLVEQVRCERTRGNRNDGLPFAICCDCRGQTWVEEKLRRLAGLVRALVSWSAVMFKRGRWVGRAHVGSLSESIAAAKMRGSGFTG